MANSLAQFCSGKKNRHYRKSDFINKSLHPHTQRHCHMDAWAHMLVQKKLRSYIRWVGHQHQTHDVGPWTIIMRSCCTQECFLIASWVNSSYWCVISNGHLKIVLLRRALLKNHKIPNLTKVTQIRAKYAEQKQFRCLVSAVISLCVNGASILLWERNKPWGDIESNMVWGLIIFHTFA